MISLKEKFQKYFRSPTILCFSISVTGRCNASCSYCHFYGMRSKETIKEIWKDIDNETYRLYINFLERIKNILPQNVNLQYRFSGGEPLVLKDRLFELADYGYKKTGIPPYILTNGLGITKNWVEKAKKHHIKYLLVSLENPFNPSVGAPQTEKIVAKIKKFNSSKLPIIPGVTIVKNDDFKVLYSTCKYFYDELGTIPTISELNFQAFENPSRKQIKDLYDNILQIVREFYNKTQLILFPYISPELSYGSKKQYLLELDILNKKYHFTGDNIDKKLELVIDHIERSYPKCRCSKKDCDWFDFCRNYKWVWNKTFNKMSLKEKQKSYCALKKTINRSFYNAIKNIKI